MAAPTIRSARLFDGGAVMVAGDVRRCTVERLGGASIEVPGALCDEAVELSIDRRDGTLFVSTSDGVYRVDATAAARVSGAGDLVAWDATLGLLYTATKGETELSALRTTGDVAWSVEAGGPIADLAARGRRGQVLALIERADGLGAIERRDGESGRLLGRSMLPDDGGDVVVSDNGRTVGIVRPGEVHFFSLDTEGDEQPVVDETPPECIDPTNNVSRD